MKKSCFFLMTLIVLSCSEEDSASELAIDIQNLDLNACDCPPPGLGGGQNDENDDDEPKPFDDFQYYGEVNINYTNDAYYISRKDLGKFYWGINLNDNGTIKDVVASNFVAKLPDAQYVGKSVNKDQVHMYLKVKGKALIKVKRKTQFDNAWILVDKWFPVKFIFDTDRLPNYSVGGGSTGGGVIPIAQ